MVTAEEGKEGGKGGVWGFLSASRRHGEEGSQEAEVRSLFLSLEPHSLTRDFQFWGLFDVMYVCYVLA